MAYATASNLVTAFGGTELAQVTGPKHLPAVDPERLEEVIAGTLDPEGEADELELEAAIAAIDSALELAEAVVDSYVSTRYTLPFATTPVILTERTLDIARYELHDEAATEEIRNRYKEAIGWLKDLATGKAKLGEPSIDAGAGVSGGFGLTTTDGPTFTLEGLASYGV